MTFKDHFSAHAELYAEFRPTYPESLFRGLAGIAPARRTALDCGTGNGQAAIGLASHFNRVIATDPSAAQIARAIPHQHVDYRVAPAEASGLAPASVDLVTAAQALHWFDIPAFFAEARRVLVPRGAIAVWGYGDPVLDTPRLQSTLHNFNRGTLENYWLPERELLLDGYRAIEFPFQELTLPPLTLERRWTLAELAGYLRTWSATSRYSDEHGADPVSELLPALASDWGIPETAHLIRWPVYMRAGRTP